FKWRGCLGTYDENEGPYTFKDGILILSPKRPNIQKGFQGTPTRFLPINWGDRLYLVSENQVLDFVNKINQGNEPRNNRFGYFYLREGDENKKVDGFPKLSAQWQEFLLKEPISGEVVKKVNRKKGIVNRGKKDGLKVGMELTARDAKDTRFTQLKVIAVEEETAKVETLYKDYKVYKGDIVSTRFY
ncbi:MAG: hypothetical protein U1E51_08555, partial [Candidatus Binatia bacterium]|nr:hypothetical protein [Candidatus Binatia bacterium]